VAPLVRRDEAAIGQDDVGFEQVVDGQAVLARQVAGATAESEARDAGAADDTERDREPEGVRGVVHVGGRTARLDAHRTSTRIHADALHTREIDDETAVAASQAGTVVPPTTYCNHELLVATEVHRGDDVGGIRAASDQPRSLVDHAVVQGAHLVVVRIRRINETSTKAGDRCLGHLLLLGTGLAFDVECVE